MSFPEIDIGPELFSLPEQIGNAANQQGRASWFMDFTSVIALACPQ
ncbi:hypothetical protein LB516_28655 [Mesorhizobium sp. CO1-1-7]|nr:MULTISPECIES: hypothetical protein [unclassified Mesorhizobium]MBZ9749212.1 hypothetical protein [Mesorhizobium sp. CO1-1-7]MBZ9757538.1 hypothetical protein [Mesorhizobium sp. ESP6-5]